MKMTLLKLTESTCIKILKLNNKAVIVENSYRANKYIERKSHVLKLNYKF